MFETDFGLYLNLILDYNWN